MSLATSSVRNVLASHPPGMRVPKRDHAIKALPANGPAQLSATPFCQGRSNKYTILGVTQSMSCAISVLISAFRMSPDVL